jgi:hypothetical protein
MEIEKSFFSSVGESQATSRKNRIGFISDNLKDVTRE